MMDHEHGDAQRGCIVLGRTLRSVSESDVELRNQITYYAPRCASVDTTRKTETGAAAGAADTTARDSVVAAKPTKGRYTLQVAAFSARADATRLAKRLEDIGLDARVVGSAKPFRVRVGRYTTRAAATAAARQLKAKKIDAIVTEAGADDK